MIMLKSTHVAEMNAKDAEIRSLKQAVEFHAARARSAQAAHRVANEVASQRAARIIKLEADNAEQSSKITTLSNLNDALKRKYEPVRGPHGRWISKSATATVTHLEKVVAA